MSSGAGESTGSGVCGASRLPTLLMQAKVTAPELPASYLAFERAGLDLGLPTTQDAWTASPPAHQVGLLARAIEQRAAPCNLHVDLACRSEPELDMATHFLDGEAVLIGAEAFRFSTGEIARYFAGELTRRELDAVEEHTAGRPIALMVHRNLRDGAAAESGSDAALFTGNYIGVRLLRDLALELDAVAAVSGHGFTSKCSHRLSILAAKTVHPQGRTPRFGQFYVTADIGGAGIARRYSRATPAPAARGRPVNPSTRQG